MLIPFIKTVDELFDSVIITGCLDIIDYYQGNNLDVNTVASETLEKFSLPLCQTQ